MPPGIFWNECALRCSLVHFEPQFWEMLQCVHWPRRVWMIFSDVVTYIVIITIFFSGNLGICGGEGSFNPSNTLHRTLNPKKGKGDCNTLRCPWNPVQIEAAWKCRHNRAVRSTTIGRKQIMETSGPKTLSSVEESIRRRSIVLQPNVPS